MSKKCVIAEVLSQVEIAPGIFDMWIRTDLVKEAKAGAFIGVYPKDKSKLLPRPISICECDKDANALRIVYRVAGGGTGEFSGYKKGDSVRIIGILGNGYDLDKLSGKKVFLMGGGIGIPPMLELAKELYAENKKLVDENKKLDAENKKLAAENKNPDAENKNPDEENKKLGSGEIIIIVGYRDSKTFLKSDLEKYGKVYIASEDGSIGTRGNVMNVISEKGLSADAICSCGPMPMLRAIKKYAEDTQIPAYISLEERMACGVGACLGCVVKTKEVDHHSHVNNARICTDGPVFLAADVDI